MSPRRSGQGITGEDTGTQADAALRVTQVRSSASTKPKHRGTLRALGLRGLGRSRVLPDRPEIRGMLARVPHLVEVQPATESELADQRRRLQAVRAEHRTAQRSGGDTHDEERS